MKNAREFTRDMLTYDVSDITITTNDTTHKARAEAFERAVNSLDKFMNIISTLSEETAQELYDSTHNALMDVCRVVYIDTLNAIENDSEL